VRESFDGDGEKSPPGDSSGRADSGKRLVCVQRIT
jgi:hypothetical protein